MKTKEGNALLSKDDGEGISFCHVLLYLKNMGRASDMAMNATHPPMVIIMVFFRICFRIVKC
ncbi:MAG: hypothetical protein II886_03200 [Prevotella sp.]|nr:hypothetical protein [Prevotella sp.]